MKIGKPHFRVAAATACAFTLATNGVAQTNVQANGMSTWTAPASASHSINPVPDDSNSIAAGKKIYSQNCVVCHGSQGNGDGPAAMALPRHPAVLSDSNMWQQSDGALFWKITEGNSPMPSFRPTLSEKQRWTIVHYLRTLAPKPAGVVSNQTVAANTPAESESAPASKQTATNAADIQDLKQSLQDLQQQALETELMAKDAFPGAVKMLIVGYGTAAFSSTQEGNGAFNNAYTAAFNPLFLWKLSDRLFFEGEIELELEGNYTTLNLEVAQASYLLNDYMSVGVGRFLNPMNFFVERQHMGWVNRLPDKPLAVYDGLLPESELGVQIRGGIPLGSTRFEYSVFNVNAPSLITDDSTAYGDLEYDNNDNINNNMALGGHAGFIPIPQFEVGYGFQYSGVAPAGNDVNAMLQSVDVNFVQQSSAWGNLNVRGQWVWSKVDPMTYNPGPDAVNFDNARNGGYAQISYRPAQVPVPIVKNLEAVARYDRLNQKQIPTIGYDEWRVTGGLDYWLTECVVAKGAYEVINENGSGANGDAFLFEFISGF